MANQPELTIIIPNYKTPELTKICLRSLRKYTDCSRVKVVAIDNDSRDASLEYLRSLKWITLMERKTGSEKGVEMHARSLDMVMETVDTPLVLVMHTDTIVVHGKWLDFLLKKINASPDIAGVGSWKLETVPPIKAFFKRIETWIRQVILRKKILDRKHYFRSHCALYKSSAVRETNGFYDNESACLSMFRILSDKGYKLPFIESEELSMYIRHLNHATSILNPIAEARKSADPRQLKKLQKQMQKMRINELLEDSSLDN